MAEGNILVGICGTKDEQNNEWYSKDGWLYKWVAFHMQVPRENCIESRGMNRLKYIQLYSNQNHKQNQFNTFLNIFQIVSLCRYGRICTIASNIWRSFITTESLLNEALKMTTGRFLFQVEKDFLFDF